MSTPPRSYALNGTLAGAALCYAVSLSRSNRGAIDWMVIGLLCLAILWNLFRLGQRLHRGGGGTALRHLQITVLLWILGVLNTALIRPADIGSWGNLLGWALLVAAAVATFLLVARERASMVQNVADREL